MKKSCLCILILCLAAGFAFSGGSGETKTQTGEEKIVLKIADAQPATHIMVRYFQKFLDSLSAKTNGRIGGEIYPSAMMGTATVIIQQMQLGALDMYRPDAAQLYDLGVDSMKILGLPFLFRDVDHAKKILYSDIGKKFLDDIEKSNVKLVGLSYFIEGERNLFLKNKRVTTLADARGLKIRIPGGRLYSEMMTCFGISGTTMAMSEIYSGLQTGIIDGAENSYDAFNTNSFHEVCKYITVSCHTLVMSPVIESQVRWQSFSAGDRKIITDAFAAMIADYDKESTDHQSNVKKQITSKGVEILELTDKARWVESVQSMYKEYGAGYEDIIKKIADS